jgi:hypothetical protein
MRTAFGNARLVHLPVHASWLNQVEIYFSILQRKVITPADAADLDELAARPLAYGTSGAPRTCSTAPACRSTGRRPVSPSSRLRRWELPSSWARRSEEAPGISG